MKVNVRWVKWLRFAIFIFASTGIFWHLLPYAFELPPALLVPRPISPRYFARDATTLRLMLDETGQRSAPEVAWHELPKALIDATIAVEDQRFFQHGGIDFFAIGRAISQNARAGRTISGASTLPQQLIKVSAPKTSRTLWRKFVEAQQARLLVRKWPRTRILATWLNRVSFGNLLIGCHAASEGYFNKPLSDLTVAECALLAGLPQSPARLNPLRQPEQAKNRQRHVLKRLLDEGYISSETYENAKTQQLVYTPFHGGFAAPHAVELLTQQTATTQITTFQTTLDSTLQHRVEQVLTNRLAGLRERHVTQAAAVVIENATGNVLALAGSRDFFSQDGGQINGAWTPHSPGSAIKPFTYLLALERGQTPASIIADLPITFSTPTGQYRPENYTGKNFGPVTLRAALGNSLNISAVKTLDHIGGSPVLLETLKRLGLTTLTETPDHYGLGLTIGNAPVRLLELANAYACLARLGEFRPWRLLIADPSPPAVRLFDPRYAWQIADILSDNQARLLTFGAHSPLRMPFKVAAKTGTSSSYRDNWALGYTPEYTVAVWAGNFDRTPMQGVSGVTGAAPILADLFTSLREQFGPTTWFQTPSGLESIRIDPRIGKRITSQSPAARLSHTDWLVSSNLPTPATTTDYDAQGRAFLPPEYRAWLTSSDNWLADLVTLGSEPQALRIVQPLAGAVYHLDPDLPDQGRRLSLQATAGYPTVTWSSPSLSVSGGPDQWTAILIPGTHLIRLHQAPRAAHAQEITITVIRD
ncbi:MAG: penicillin-binding protein 1C [Verrucomicrobiaceae bacterium]|nr:penicillin-binding protein 1C [Verrucomicrobiaceae bacterium]